MENKNVVLFSSGVSEKSGMLSALAELLAKRGYACAYWRDLFSGAHDSQNIALLPTLIKKIPTFDYAVLICEGHDRIAMRRGEEIEQASVMRDNVLFEIGLCVMALGLTRTILLTDEAVRLPDDLIGLHGEVALKRVIYSKGQEDSYKPAAREVLSYVEQLECAAEQIDRYIRLSGGTLTPVVIGAASATACGYADNFIFRLLEHLDEGMECEGKRCPVDLSRVFVHIVLPKEYSPDAAASAQAALRQYRSGTVKGARSREVSFRFWEENGELHMIDFPTSIGTSYETARMILAIDADDQADEAASRRFLQKELNLFEATLKALLCEEFLEHALGANYPGLPPAERESMKRAVLQVVPDHVQIERRAY